MKLKILIFILVLYRVSGEDLTVSFPPLKEYDSVVPLLTDITPFPESRKIVRRSKWKPDNRGYELFYLSDDGAYSSRETGVVLLHHSGVKAGIQEILLTGSFDALIVHDLFVYTDSSLYQVRFQKHADENTIRGVQVLSQKLIEVPGVKGRILQVRARDVCIVQGFPETSTPHWIWFQVYNGFKKLAESRSTESWLKYGAPELSALPGGGFEIVRKSIFDKMPSQRVYIFKDKRLQFPSLGQVAGDDIPVRSVPDVTGFITGYWKKGEQVMLLESSIRKETREGVEDHWFLIRSEEGKEGWIHSVYIDTHSYKYPREEELRIYRILHQRNPANLNSE